MVDGENTFTDQNLPFFGFSRLIWVRQQHPVRVDNMLYLSGQVGNIPGTWNLVPGGVVPETRQILENIKAILESHNSSLDRVVKCTVFMVDINEWPKMNEVYRTYFSANPPARSAVAGSGLALNARVEIECIAVVN